MSSPNRTDSTSGAGPLEFKRRGRIVYTLLAVLVFCGLAPLGTVAWKLIDLNREALTTSQQQYQLLLARSIANEVDIHVEGLRSTVQRLAQTVGNVVSRNRTARDEETQRVFGGVIDERMPYLRYSYFRGREVKTVTAGSLPESLEPIFANSFQDAAEDVASRAADLAHAVRTSDPILLDDGSGRSTLVITAPVVHGGRFRGVLSALVDLGPVWSSVVGHDRSGHTIFALDRNGQLFASSNPHRVRPGSDVTGSPLVERYLSADGRASETMPFVEHSGDLEESFLGSYELTRDGWGIFITARLEQIYLPVQHMVRSTVSWALAALSLAIIAALIFARTLSLPANRLVAASRAFASGQFSTRVRVRSGNEIGELAFTFNRMASEIEDHIQRLKTAAEENKELFFGTIRALAQAIDAKDPYTRGHSVRVNQYSVLIAQQLGLDEKQIQDIHVSSLMHDVGKIGIEDHILKKRGKLTEEEFDVMKTHPVLGANIMAPIRKMKRMLPGLRWHHERWTGGGYPDGLVGEKIPLMARIIAVADAFDAMTTHRPYQTAMSFDEAHHRINTVLKGSAFDESVVEAFNRAYRQGAIRPEREQPAAPPDASEPTPVAAVSEVAS